VRGDLVLRVAHIPMPGHVASITSNGASSSDPSSNDGLSASA
jgi:hypothetical protein